MEMAELTETMRLQEKEHEAWLEFVRAFRKVFPGVDLNDSKYTPMIRRIEFWGETLVNLRLNQTEAERTAAYDARKELLDG